MDWKQEIENQASKEFAILAEKPISELLIMLHDGKLGTLSVVLRALTLHGNIKDIGWPLFEAIDKQENDSNRVACVTALMESLCSNKLKIKPFHFLEKDESYHKNLIALEAELINKIGERQ